MLTKIRMRPRLLSLVAAPLIAIVIVGAISVSKIHTERAHMTTLSATVELAVAVSTVVHELQKERGATALYMGSKGEKFGAELAEQRTATSARLSDLESYLESHALPVGEAGTQLSGMMNKLRNLASTRDQAKNLSIKTSEAISFYTKVNAMGLGVVDSLAVLTDNSMLKQKIASLASLSYAKERAGIERAVLANSFARGSFAKGFRDRLLRLVAEQDAFTVRFRGWADANTIAAFDAAMAEPSAAAATQMRTEALAAEGALTGEASTWFGRQTDKVNQLRRIETKLADELKSSASALANEATNALLLWSIGLLLLIAFTSTLSWLIIRSVTQPLTEITTAAKAVARGDVGRQIHYEGNDEVGELADAFRDMNHSGRAMADAVQQVSRGEEAGFEPRSDDDVVGHAVVRLDNVITELMSAVQQQVEGAGQGSLDVRVDAERFEGRYRMLAKSLNDMMEASTAPIREAASCLSALARRNLTTRMINAYSGEYGAMKGSLNEAATYLDQSFGQVSTAAAHVFSAADEIRAGSESLASQASEQASSLQDISNSLRDVDAITKSNAEEAASASQFASSAQESAQEGSTSMEKLSEAMGRIKGAADETAKIVSTIDEIAFQTNLLALNAAVEAARAGDAGKGFAVVAEEVRMLAKRSAEAAQTTSARIEEAVTSVNEGVVMNQEALERLQEIFDRVARCANVVGTIADRSAEQSQSVQQISVGMAELNEVTQQIAGYSQESASAAHELSAQSRSLHQLVGDFKISANSGGAQLSPERWQSSAA